MVLTHSLLLLPVHRLILTNWRTFSSQSFSAHLLSFQSQISVLVTIVSLADVRCLRDLA